MNSEVRTINVPRYKTLSLKHVLQYAVSDRKISGYLPDLIVDSEPHVDREFVFTIVNTCDPSYFPAQLARIEKEKLDSAQRLEEDVIEVRPEIMQLLEQFGASAFKSANKASCARSLALLKKKGKKRSRAEFEASHDRPAISTSLVATGNPTKRRLLNPQPANPS